MFRITIITFCFLCNLLHAKHIRLGIEKAVNLKLVKTSVSSLGGYQGFCIRISFSNLTKDSLIIDLEAGRRLNSLDDKFQDILVVKQEEIFLKAQESKAQNIKGYCCQANNASPGLGAKYSINRMAEPGLSMLAGFLNTHHFESGTEQSAVWAVSDNGLTAGITGSNDTIAEPLRCFVATIKGEPIPWYTVISSSFTYPSGRIITIPKYLKGELDYNISQKVYSTCYILNKEGMPVSIIRGSWLMPGNDNKYPLHIPVKGLAKGSYTIELRSDSTMLATREFRL